MTEAMAMASLEAGNNKNFDFISFSAMKYFHLCSTRDKIILHILHKNRFLLFFSSPNFVKYKTVQVVLTTVKI